MKKKIENRFPMNKNSDVEIEKNIIDIENNIINTAKNEDEIISENVENEFINSIIVPPNDLSERMELSTQEQELVTDLVYDDFESPLHKTTLNKVAYSSKNDLTFETVEAYNKDNIPKKIKEQISTKRKIAFIIVLIAFLISLTFLIVNLVNYKRASNIYDNLRSIVSGDNQNIDFLHYSEGEISDQPTKKLLSNFNLDEKYQEDYQNEKKEQFLKIAPVIESLGEINSDLFGWIKIKGTKIDYPMALGEDNSFYLNHTFDKTYLGAGTIFADFRNSKKITENRNIVLYGHNMNDGSMFAGLMKFKEESFFLKTKIQIISTSGVYIYTPFAVFSTDYKDKYFQTSFNNDEDFKKFLTTYKEKSMHHSANNIELTDKILTLSTCTNILNTGRFVVMAYLSDITE